MGYIKMNQAHGLKGKVHSPHVGSYEGVMYGYLYGTMTKQIYATQTRALEPHSRDDAGFLAYSEMYIS